MEDPTPREGTELSQNNVIVLTNKNVIILTNKIKVKCWNILLTLIMQLVTLGITDSIVYFLETRAGYLKS